MKYLILLLTLLPVVAFSQPGAKINLNQLQHAPSADYYIKSISGGVPVWDLISNIAIPPSGSAGGDLTGTYPNPTIANNAVTNAKAADMAVNTIKGRIAAGTGDPQDLTASQVRTIINVADGAEVNVNADWNAVSGDAQILNKPVVTNWSGGSTGLDAATGRTSLGGTTVGQALFTLPNPSQTRYLRINADNSVTTRIAADFRVDLGGTTVGQSFFTLTNPSAITFPRINANNTVSALSASDFRTAIGAGTGNGTVTSVGLTMPNIFTVSGSPVTSSGNLVVSLEPVGEMLVLAGPIMPGGGVPSFTSLTTSHIQSGTFGIERGGTGLSTLGTAGQSLRVNSGATGLEWFTPSSGGSPGGSNTQLQYNNSGSFGGIANATTNGTDIFLKQPIIIPDGSNVSEIKMQFGGSGLSRSSLSFMKSNMVDEYGSLSCDIDGLRLSNEYNEIYLNHSSGSMRFSTYGSSAGDVEFALAGDDPAFKVGLYSDITSEEHIEETKIYSTPSLGSVLSKYVYEVSLNTPTYTFYPNGLLSTEFSAYNELTDDVLYTLPTTSGTVGQVLTISSDGVNTEWSTPSGGGSDPDIIAVTGNLTLNASTHHGEVLHVTSGGAAPYLTITTPSSLSGFSPGWNCVIINDHSNPTSVYVQINVGSGQTLLSEDSKNVLKGKGSHATLIYLGGSRWALSGSLQ